MRAECRKMEMEQRKYPRVEICNLISYLSVMENGEITDQSIGKALNISQSGIHINCYWLKDKIVFPFQYIFNARMGSRI